MNVKRYIAKAIWCALLMATGMLPSMATNALAVTCPAGVFPAVSTAPTSVDPQSALTGDFVSPIIDANALKKYVTPLPNPLDPSFIYTPAGTQGGETWYTVSERQISQGIGLIYNNPLNAADPNNGCTAPPATFWVYGDARDNGIAPYTGKPAGHTYPSATFEVTSNTPTRVTWTNELPATHPLAIDPTLDCGPKAPNCYPFNRTVPHVHGSHVVDDSDGNPDAWFSSNFGVTGQNWSPNTQYGPVGTYRYENSQEAGTLWYHDHAMGLTHQNAYIGLAGFYLVRDANELALQAPIAATATTLAVPAVLPKFPFEVPIVLQDRVISTAGQPITPDAPLLDKAFVLPNGTACDPLAAVGSPTACTALNPTTVPNGTVCDPLATAGAATACPTVKFSADATRPGALIPSPTGMLTAPSITPEFFGNIMLVNGQAYPKLDVEKRVYRLRLLNGSDSRTYIMRLVDGTTKLPIPGLDIWQIGTEQALLNNPVKPMTTDPTVTTVAPCPVGSPVGLVCYSPVGTQTNAMVLMAGERVDLLIDFKKVPAGTTSVILQNVGPDAPYTGEYPPIPDQLVAGVLIPGNGQVPTVLTPEIMSFNVLATLSATADTLDPTLIGTVGQRALRPANIALPALKASAGSTSKKLYLQERMGPYGRFMLTINGKDYMQALNELTVLGDTEDWEFYNLTPDGHPMHLHLVSFQTVNRQGLLAATGGVANVPATPYAPPAIRPPVNAAMVTTDFALDPAGITAPAANEALAWKDTIFVPPGSITRVRATFDIPGLYVYHCHILSHEENDMMRPNAVITPATGVTLTASTATNSQPAGSTAPVTFTAAAVTGNAVYKTSNAFEYNFSVTSPAGVVTPLDNLGMSVPGTVAGYTYIRTTTWTPPAVPGTYVVTVNAKAMGPIDPVANPVKTTTLNYVIAAASVAGATSTTPAGSYKAGSSINVTLTFSQAVSSTAGLAITLNNGVVLNTGALANQASFSGTFVVAAGQDTPAGQSLDVTSIVGSVTDAMGNAVSTLAVPTGANISNSVAIVTDTTAPVSQAVTLPGTYASPISVVLSMNEAGTIYYTTDGTPASLNSTKYTGPITLSSTTATTVTINFFAVDLANNAEATPHSAVYTLTAQHPADLTAKIAINNGSAYTNSVNAKLSMSASDPAGVTAYAISTDNVTYVTTAITPAVKVFSATNVPVTLPTGDGLKTVYVKFTDALGVVYPPVTASITLETALPVVAFTPAAGDYAGRITVALSSPSEPEGAKIYYTTDGSTPSATSKTTVVYKNPFTIGTAGTTIVVKFFAIDNAGNVGTVQSASYRFVANPDMTADVNINNDAKYTNTRNVFLKVKASDPIGGGVGTMAFSNDGVNFTTPVPYVATNAMPWVLTSGNGVKTVYFRFTDKGTTGVAPIAYTFTAKIVLAEGVVLSTGDCDGNGKVELYDSSMALQASTGTLRLTIEQQARCDVGPLVAGKPQPDGNVNSGDSLLISQKVIGLVSF